MSGDRDNRKRVAVVACPSYDIEQISEAVHRIMGLIGEQLPTIQSRDQILLKPNLCLPELPEQAITTHPSLVWAVGKWAAHYSENIYMGDSPVGEATPARQQLIAQKTGMEELVQDHDLNLRGLEFHQQLILQETQINDQKIAYYLTKQVNDIDYLINLPKFKTHSLMTFTGAVKNLYGLLPGSSKKALHYQLPDKYDFAKLQLDIYKRVRPMVNIMDAVWGIEGEGPGKRGKRKYIGCILASTDAIALDMVCAKILKISNRYIPINALALENGYGEETIEIVGDNIADFIPADYQIPKSAYAIKTDEKYISRVFKMAKESVQFDYAKCVKCGLCIDVCPAQALFLDDVVVANQSKCIACKTCIEICPQGAIDVKHSKLYQQIRGVGS